MKYTKILFLLGVFTLFFSCELDEVPRDKVPGGGYTSVPQTEQSVIGIYANLRQLSNDLYLHLSECRSDNTWVNPAPNGLREYSEIGTFRADNSLSTFRNVWKDLYSVINAANLVIENIPNVNFPQDELSKVKLKSQLEGEAYFLRGWAYFELARLFGNVPIIDHPMLLAETRKVKQSPAKDVYEKMVIPDLKKAEESLPLLSEMVTAEYTTAAAQGRADRIAAKAMLGRVYMTMSGFPVKDASAEGLAEVKLKEVLDFASTNNKYWAPDSTEWRKQWVREYNNKYSIFAIQYRVGGISGNPAIFNFSPALPKSYTEQSIFGNAIYVEKTLQYQFNRVFKNGHTDARGIGFTVLNGFDAEPNFPAYSNTIESVDIEGVGEVEVYTKSFFYKYLDSIRKRNELGFSANYESEIKDRSDWPINLPIIRLEDIMLMYAEVLVNKQGKVSEALSYVNKIRERAGCDPVIATNAADAMAAIKQERRLEFAAEGVRWFDMVRWGEWEKDVRNMLNRYNNPDGTSQAYVKPGRYLCPIPQTEMIGFTGLYVQNPDY